MTGAGGDTCAGECECADTVLSAEGMRTPQPRTRAGVGGSESATRNLSIRCMGRATCRAPRMTPATAPPPP